MSKKMCIDDVDVKGKRVFMRCDFNVPLTEDLEVSDDRRIVSAIPSIRKVLNGGGRLVLASHLGRPKGVPKQEFSLKPVAQRLSDLLGQPVRLAPDCIGPEVMLYVEKLQEGEAILLENVRFHAGETANDPEFAASLARLGDIFINNAFGTAHRSHASTVGITEFLQPAVAGDLMVKENTYLNDTLQNPDRPFWAVMGGAKIKGKLDVIENLLEKVDGLLLGGAMTFTLAVAEGLSVGNSLVETESLDIARELLEKFKNTNVDVRLPIDYVVADKFAADANTQVVSKDNIPLDWYGLDIGPKTCKLYAELLNSAHTTIWNGPMGVFEMEAFRKGTQCIAEALARSTENSNITIIGGGDSAAAIHLFDMDDKFTHISTGGGASLEFLKGKELPGFSSLTDSNT